MMRWDRDWLLGLVGVITLAAVFGLAVEGCAALGWREVTVRIAGADGGVADAGGVR